MTGILKIIVDILSVPAVLVGLIALLGLVAQKKPVEVVISGTLKTTLGFLILGAGAGVVINAIVPLGDILQHGFNIKGVIAVNEVVIAIAQKQFGTEMALTMVAGFAANVIFALILPWKYIFLSGHHTLFMATVAVAVLGAGAGITGLPLILSGALVIGFSSIFFPAISAPFMKKITGGDEFVMGHWGTTGYCLSGLIGKLVGNPDDSTENIQLPSWANFMREPLIAMGIVMSIVYMIAVLKAGPEFVATKSGGQWPVLYAVMQGLLFAGGIGVILLGVRMILAEIVPAFRGFAERIVPNSKPALDCPVVFPYAPNALLIGYLFSTLGGIVAMFIQIAAGWTVMVPSMIIHFFCGGTSGIFGNATGGKKGAMLGAFTHGILVTLLSGFLYPLMGSIGFANTTFGDSDFSIMGIVLGFLAKLVAGK